MSQYYELGACAAVKRRYPGMNGNFIFTVSRCLPWSVSEIRDVLLPYLVCSYKIHVFIVNMGKI